MNAVDYIAQFECDLEKLHISMRSFGSEGWVHKDCINVSSKILYVSENPIRLQLKPFRIGGRNVQRQSVEINTNHVFSSEHRCAKGESSRSCAKVQHAFLFDISM